MNKTAMMDRYYLDCRCQILELASTLDRLDRVPASHLPAPPDERLSLLLQALHIVTEPADRPNRTFRILNLLSDPVSPPST